RTYAWLVVLVGVTIAGVSSSSTMAVSVPEIDRAEDLTSIGASPDAATLGAAKAFVTLLTVLEDSPTTTDPLVYDRGGMVLTPPELDNEKRRNKPQIRID